MRTRFTDLDRLTCGIVGVSRNASAWQKVMALEGGRTDLGIDRHVIGAMGEFAVARLLGLNWNPVTGVTDTARGDLENLQVKSITARNRSLIVRPHDPDEFPYVLVFVSMMEAEILGWISGKEAKRSHYFREADPSRGIHQAAYFVPAKDLKPISTL